MNTKLKGDIAEQAAILRALRFGWGVLKPVGDRLPYDLVFDVAGTLVKVQVKSAWYYESQGNYIADNRRCKTNRREMIHDSYSVLDFDFALLFLEELSLFYVFPVEVFLSYASQIHLVESEKRQRKPRSAKYRDAWNLITSWAASKETLMRTPVKVGEAYCGGNPEPSSGEIHQKRCRDLTAGIFPTLTELKDEGKVQTTN